MDEKIKEAIDAIELGDNARAYKLLKEVIEEDPRSRSAENAWIWMSTLYVEPSKKRQCLETVLLINPRNVLAKERLSEISSKLDVSNEQMIEPQHTISQSQIGSSIPKGDRRSQSTKSKKSALYVLIFVGTFAMCGLMFCSFLASIMGDSQAPGSSNPNNLSNDPVDYIEIVEWDWETSFSGSYIEVLGTIRNNHPSKRACFVEFLTRLQDSNGVDLNTNTGYADSSFIEPGATSPFAIYIQSVEGWRYVTIEVTDASFNLCD